MGLLSALGEAHSRHYFRLTVLGLYLVDYYDKIAAKNIEHTIDIHTNCGRITRLLRGIRYNRSDPNTQHHQKGDHRDIKHPLCYGRRHFRSLHH